MPVPLIELFFVAFTGLFIGSFLNVLADRLPQGRTILGRSQCDSCEHILSWMDLVPILSFAFLKARCRYCRASLSFQYPLAELITSALFTLTWIFAQNIHLGYINSILMLLLISVLFVMLLADLRYQILPDEMQVAMGVISLSLLISKYALLYSPYDFAKLLGSNIVNGLLVMLPLLIVFLLTKGRGMGFGDVKFAFNMGLLLGLWGGLSALYLGFLSGGIVGGFLLLTKKGNRKSKIAFGPFLILGTYLVLFFENDVILIISRMYGFNY